MPVERTVTPVTPSKFNYENNDTEMRCVGKSMTFQSKSHLGTPSIKPWLRSPNLNSKSKNISPRSQQLNEGNKNAQDEAWRSKQFENIFPAIVATKNNTRTSSISCCKQSKKNIKKDQKQEELEMRHNLPKMNVGQQLRRLQSELPEIIMGKMIFNAIYKHFMSSA